MGNFSSRAHETGLDLEDLRENFPLIFETILSHCKNKKLRLVSKGWRDVIDRFPLRHHINSLGLSMRREIIEQQLQRTYSQYQDIHEQSKLSNFVSSYIFDEFQLWSYHQYIAKSNPHFKFESKHRLLLVAQYYRTSRTSLREFLNSSINNLLHLFVTFVMSDAPVHTFGQLIHHCMDDIIICLTDPHHYSKFEYLKCPSTIDFFLMPQFSEIIQMKLDKSIMNFNAVFVNMLIHFDSIPTIYYVSKIVKTLQVKGCRIIGQHNGSFFWTDVINIPLLQEKPDHPKFIPPHQKNNKLKSQNEDDEILLI